MPFGTIEQAIADIHAGRLVVVADDPAPQRARRFHGLPQRPRHGTTCWSRLVYHRGSRRTFSRVYAQSRPRRSSGSPVRSRRRLRMLTPEEQSELQRLLREHIPLRAIARRLGRDVKTIRRALGRRSPPPSPSKLAPYQALAQERFEAGLRSPRILRELRERGYTGGLTILHGSLAPEGAVVKTAGFDAAKHTLDDRCRRRFGNERDPLDLGVALQDRGDHEGAIDAYVPELPYWSANRIGGYSENAGGLDETLLRTTQRNYDLEKNRSDAKRGEYNLLPHQVARIEKRPGEGEAESREERDALHARVQAAGCRIFVPLERISKGVMFDCRMCGHCILQSTGLTCPMRCPKNLRNGPCGGVRSNGNCEVYPYTPCVWVQAIERSTRLPIWRDHIHRLQPPVDWQLQGTSSWINLFTGRDAVRPRGWVNANEPNR